MTSLLPHLNATLNLIATLLLVSGYVLIRRRRERAHKWTMISCFAVSTMFLTSYLVYHAQEGSKKFPADDYSPALEYVYKGVLLTHVLLAAVVPFLAVATIGLALADRRQAHRRLARWTFPIWLYVSVTGVLVYLMLYWLFTAVD